jgi:hypothetical protein
MLDADDALFCSALARASLHAAETCASFCFRQAAMWPCPRSTPEHSFSASALQAARGLVFGGWSAANATLAENPRLAKISTALLMTTPSKVGGFPDNARQRIQMTLDM